MKYPIPEKVIPKWSAFLFSFILLLFTACDSEKEINFGEEEKSAYESEESAENLFDAIESITNAAMKVPETSAGGRMAEITDPELACAEVSFSGTKESGSIEIDFGEGCEGPDGKIRKGIVFIQFEGNRLVKNSKIYTMLKNFYINDLNIEGTLIITNITTDIQSLTYKVEIFNGKIIWPDKTFLTRACERTQKWIFGDQLNDIELQVEGEASGKTRLGIEYFSETAEPLVFKSTCWTNAVYFPVSGVKTVTIPEKPAITINYGGGECDNKYTVSIGDDTKDIDI